MIESIAADCRSWPHERNVQRNGRPCCMRQGGMVINSVMAGSAVSIPASLWSSVRKFPVWKTASPTNTTQVKAAKMDDCPRQRGQRPRTTLNKGVILIANMVNGEEVTEVVGAAEIEEYSIGDEGSQYNPVSIHFRAPGLQTERYQEKDLDGIEGLGGNRRREAVGTASIPPESNLAIQLLMTNLIGFPPRRSRDG